MYRRRPAATLILNSTCERDAHKTAAGTDGGTRF